jgi:hypothetical protein
MYGWILAGLFLGILVSSLIRRIPGSSLVEMTYITVAAVVDGWRQRRKSPGQAPPADVPVKEKGLSAAASRFTLL